MLFHQLDTCEYECFCLAGALATDVDDRAILFEIFTAGKYPRYSRFCFRLVILGIRLLVSGPIPTMHTGLNV